MRVAVELIGCWCTTGCSAAAAAAGGGDVASAAIVVVCSKESKHDIASHLRTYRSKPMRHIDKHARCVCVRVRTP